VFCRPFQSFIHSDLCGFFDSVSCSFDLIVVVLLYCSLRFACFLLKTCVALLCGNCVQLFFPSSSSSILRCAQQVLSRLSSMFFFSLCRSMLVVHIMLFLQLHVHGFYVHAMVTLVKLFCGCR